MRRHRGQTFTARTNRRGASPIGLLVAIAVIGILIALLLPAIGAARSAARQADCQSKLRQLSLACQMYAMKNGNAIMSGIVTAKHQSGLVAILPYLEATQLFRQYDAAKTADKNDVVATKIPIFICSSDPDTADWTSPGKGTYARSNYVMNFGSGTLDPGKAKTKEGGTLYGPFLLNKANSIDAMRDGMVQTALFSEVIAGGRDGKQPDGAWGYGDAGTAAYTHLHTPNARAAVTVLGGGGNWTKAQATASSRHPGGVNVTFAGANTNFVDNQIDATVWKSSGTADGKE